MKGEIEMIELFEKVREQELLINSFVEELKFRCTEGLEVGKHSHEEFMLMTNVIQRKISDMIGRGLAMDTIKISKEYNS